MNPIIPHKYDRGFIIKNCNPKILIGLEPWCSTVYVDIEYSEYIQLEQPHTTLELNQRIKPYDNEKQNNILVEIDGMTFNQQDYNTIERLSEIIQDSGEVGEFELGNLKIEIIQLNTYEKNLIKC